MKVFISQPMRGKTDEEIQEERERIETALKEKYGDVKILASEIKTAPLNAPPLWYLGKSLMILAAADVICFAKGWEDYRGCRIEHACASEYGIEIIEAT